MRLIRWAVLVAGGVAGGLMFGGCASATTAKVALPTATSGAIQLSTDRTSYTVNQPIGIILKNTTGTTYYAVTGHADCTFLDLQQYQNGTWKDVSQCGQNVNAQTLTIAGQQSEPFTLTPGSPDSENAWAPGTYRIALVASTSPNGKTDTAYSAGFAVHS